jgi:hypothetical protein
LDGPLALVASVAPPAGVESHGREQTVTVPPDERLDGPVHTWFGLTYANYLVLHRTLMQSMPLPWQERMVDCLEELHDAFGHLEFPDGYIIEPARESTYGDLTDAERRLLDVQVDEHDGDEHYYDRRGDEHSAHDRVQVPTGADPIPHYNRGRTFVEPREGDDEPAPADAG